MPDTSLTSTDASKEHYEAYEIAERIAVGPAGIVYRALQSGTHREVLFKVLNPDATHPLNSARVSSIKSSVDSVRHRCIAEWIDAYDDPDGYVLVFDYKKGIAGNFYPDEDRHLSVADGLRLAAQFCEVLQAAEQASFPHGDIKPSNIIIWNDPELGLSLQVLDWGLSSCRSQNPPESLDCMSPERLQGAAPSSAGDLFSVGVTLTFLLTGCYPVQGSTPEELITGWQNFNPASIALVRPDLGDHFCQWLAALMSFKSEDRPAAASHAIEALNLAIAVATMPQSAPSSAPALHLPFRAIKNKPRPAPPRAKVASPPRYLSHKASFQIRTTVLNPTSARKKSGTKRLMRVALAFCLVVSLAAASCIWAQKHYGIKWNDLLAGRWRGDRLQK